MLSLANAFSEEDLENFEKKIINFLSKEKDFKIFYSAEPKIDGISASLNYKNGKLLRGLSRGDGEEGEEGEVVEGEDSSSDQDDADNDSSEEAESSD